MSATWPSFPSPNLRAEVRLGFGAQNRRSEVEGKGLDSPILTQLANRREVNILVGRGPLACPRPLTAILLVLPVTRPRPELITGLPALFPLS